MKKIAHPFALKSSFSARLVCAGVALAVLGACSPAQEQPSQETTQATNAAASAAPTEQASAKETAQPQRIVAVTSDVAGIVLALTGGERVVAVPASVEAPAGVEATLPPGTDPEVEQVLALSPDLVITTTRHGGEETLAQQLEATGVQSLVVDPEQFGTPEGVAAATRTIGQAIGLKDEAERQVKQFEEEIAALDAQALTDGPTALALMVRGPQVMAMDQGLMLPGLITRAGATYQAQAIGLQNTRPIDAEQLLKANPEVLFVEDFQGKGIAPFESLLNNPAVASVPAIQHNRVYVISQSEASGISGLKTPEGYRAILTNLKQTS
ncbi:ABC transporter substrate-binding protein [Corynebacterium kozikiae]|uniref:ABC transporter substrate-binding protein n=1 Tax=Corynebacterium kozikiae TaxID=2968469 RepID=UPI00211CAD48|nr:ABC transporter substrate-binding protein [Corynebacterium sp. 76QC2CO]MCQ9343059.1 ABC transporter substrate-binding protein [Corynebacterium sp. 76QC2CO]